MAQIKRHFASAPWYRKVSLAPFWVPNGIAEESEQTTPPPPKKTKGKRNEKKEKKRVRCLKKSEDHGTEEGGASRKYMERGMSLLISYPKEALYSYPFET